MYGKDKTRAVARKRDPKNEGVSGREEGREEGQEEGWEEGREEGKCEENEYDMTDMGRKRENRGVLRERYPGR